MSFWKRISVGVVSNIHIILFFIQSSQNLYNFLKIHYVRFNSLTLIWTAVSWGDETESTSKKTNFKLWVSKINSNPTNTHPIFQQYLIKVIHNKLIGLANVAHKSESILDFGKRLQVLLTRLAQCACSFPAKKICAEYKIFYF